MRQALALLLALPCLSLPAFRSEAELEAVTSLDVKTVALANYVGDASFALTGSLAAGVEGMDLFGCVVVGFVTALGGGTLRDLGLGQLPLFWMVDWDESLLCVLCSAAAFFLWPRLSRALRLRTSDEWLFWTDTVGLGAFAALGAHKAAAIEPPVHFGACAASGMFSATFGGLLRDVLCQKPPRILYSAREVYALPALCGAAATAAVIRLCAPTMWAEAITLGFWVTIELRVLAVNHALRLPTFPRGDVQAPAQSRMHARALEHSSSIGALDGSAGGPSSGDDGKAGLAPLLGPNSPAGVALLSV